MRNVRVNAQPRGVRGSPGAGRVPGCPTALGAAPLIPAARPCLGRAAAARSVLVRMRTSAGALRGQVL